MNHLRVLWRLAVEGDVKPKFIPAKPKPWPELGRFFVSFGKGVAGYVFLMETSGKKGMWYAVRPGRDAKSDGPYTSRAAAAETLR